MTFVVESISESDKTKYPYVNTDLSSMWVIDRDHGVFMALISKLGGAYEGTQTTKCYVLGGLGAQVFIHADPQPLQFTEQGPVMSWRVHELKIPTALQNRKQDILQLTCDAFKAVGSCFDGFRYFAVKVEFDFRAETNCREMP